MIITLAIVGLSCLIIGYWSVAYGTTPPVAYRGAAIFIAGLLLSLVAFFSIALAAPSLQAINAAYAGRSFPLMLNTGEQMQVTILHVDRIKGDKYAIIVEAR